MPELPQFPADAITGPFDSLLLVMSNKLEREDAPKLSGPQGVRSVLLAFLRLSINTYQTIRFLIAEVPENPARKPEFVLSAPPLTRTILDALCSVVFLFGDLKGRGVCYMKAGWREIAEENLRFKNEYGEDPEWQEYLDVHRELLEKVQIAAGITSEEADDPSSVQYWPIPSQMIRQSSAASDRQGFLQYLYDWHYKVLSQDTHGSLPGLVRRASPLMPDFVNAPERDDWLRKLQSDSFVASVTLTLAIVSELEVELEFGISESIQYIWTILGDSSEDAKQLYERYYAPHFRPN